MRILGIDPGLANTGWGIVDFNRQRFSPVSFGMVRTNTSNTLEDRIEKIASEITKVAKANSIEVVGIEDIYFARNVSSSIKVAKVIGAIVCLLRQNDFPVYMFTPLQIKAAVTGSGASDKKQVQEMTRRILGFKEIPKPDHSADALAAAVCLANNLCTLRKFKND